MEEDNTDLPCPSPSPFRSSSLLKDISNFKTPKRSAFSLNAQSPSTQYFTAPKSKHTTLRRPNKSSMAASKKLKAFQLKQYHSSRNAQIKKEQSLKSLAKSLTVWLNFLLESPASCGCNLSIAGVQVADASPATRGKRDNVSRNSVGVDSSWRTPKRQMKTVACSSRVGKEIVSNADSQSSSFSRLKDSLKDVCSFDDFKQRMSVYLSLGACEDIFQVMNQVTRLFFDDSIHNIKTGKSLGLHTVLDAWWLYIVRLLVGCGIGLLSYVVPVYIAEITPKNLRGRFTAVHQLLSLPFIPDSPRWLAKVGRLQESDSSLQRLRGKNADVYKEANEIRDYTDTLQQQTEASIIGLFQLQYLKSLTVGLGLMILQQFGGINGIVFYANSIFTSAGFSESIGTIAMVAVKIPMTTLGVFLLDKSGRRPLLLLSAVGTCLGCFLAALSFFLQDLHTWKEVSPILALVGVLIYVGFFSLGMGAIPWVIMSEIFPINVKGSAGSLVTLVNWLCSWIVSYAFNFLMTWSSTGTFLGFAVVCGFTIIFVAKLVPETKGRTLEEIQASLNSNSIKR